MPLPSTTDSTTSAPFKYIAGDPALDLVNTVDWTSRGPDQERLTSFDRLIEWAEGAGILSSRMAARTRQQGRLHPKEAALAYRAAIRVREVLWRLFGALTRREPLGDALDQFNRLLRQSTGHLQIASLAERRGDRTFQLTWDDLGESLESVLRPVVWSAASLLVSDERDSVRVCGGPDCGWMYVDRSRNRLRRWCQMQTCGTREKSRRRYRRAAQAG